MLYMLDMLVVMAKCRFRAFMTDEKGDVNVLSMVVLMGIAVLLAIVFKDEIGKLVKKLLGEITTKATGSVTDPI